MFSVYPESTDISTSDYSEINVMTSTRAANKKKGPEDSEGKKEEEKEEGKDSIGDDDPVRPEEIEKLEDYDDDVDTELTDADAITQRDVIHNLNEELKKSKLEITKAKRQAKVNSTELARLNSMVAKLKSKSTTTNLTGRSTIASSIGGKKLSTSKSKESLKTLLKKAQKRGFKVTRKHIAIASTNRIQSKMSREEVSKLRDSLISYSDGHDIIHHKRGTNMNIRDNSTVQSAKKRKVDDEDQKDEEDDKEEEEEIYHFKDVKGNLKDDLNFDDYDDKEDKGGAGISA